MRALGGDVAGRKKQPNSKNTHGAQKVRLRSWLHETKLIARLLQVKPVRLQRFASSVSVVYLCDIIPPKWPPHPLKRLATRPTSPQPSWRSRAPAPSPRRPTEPPSESFWRAAKRRRSKDLLSTSTLFAARDRRPRST